MRGGLGAIGIAVASEKALSTGRLKRKLFMSSPTVCSESAAEPPLPQTSSFLPARKDPAINSRAARTSASQASISG